MATSEEFLEEAWDADDVEAALTDHEELLQQAFDLKNELREKLTASA